jgi:hypothetical protein
MHICVSARSALPSLWGDAPLPEMRVMTKDRRDGIKLADDLPNYDGHSGKFMLRLIAAWIAMGFRRPEINWRKTVRKS